MTFMLVFRLLHIVAGVLWVGSSFMFVAFIGPSAAEVGPSAGPLLHAVVKKRKVRRLSPACPSSPCWPAGSCGFAT